MADWELDFDDSGEDTGLAPGQGFIHFRSRSPSLNPLVDREGGDADLEGHRRRLDCPPPQSA